MYQLRAFQSPPWAQYGFSFSLLVSGCPFPTPIAFGEPRSSGSLWLSPWEPGEDAASTHTGLKGWATPRGTTTSSFIGFEMPVLSLREPLSSVPANTVFNCISPALPAEADCTGPTAQWDSWRGVFITKEKHQLFGDRDGGPSTLANVLNWGRLNSAISSTARCLSGRCFPPNICFICSSERNICFFCTWGGLQCLCQPFPKLSLPCASLDRELEPYLGGCLGRKLASPFVQ